MPRTRKVDDVMRARGYISVPHAAALTGMSEQGLRLWLIGDKPKVQSMRYGARWFVSVASLRAFLGPDASEMFGLPELAKTKIKTAEEDH
jgi:hypothetical protein